MTKRAVCRIKLQKNMEAILEEVVSAEDLKVNLQAIPPQFNFKSLNINCSNRYFYSSSLQSKVLHFVHAFRRYKIDCH